MSFGHHGDLQLRTSLDAASLPTATCCFAATTTPAPPPAPTTTTTTIIYLYCNCYLLLATFYLLLTTCYLLLTTYYLLLTTYNNNNNYYYCYNFYYRYYYFFLAPVPLLPATGVASGAGGSDTSCRASVSCTQRFKLSLQERIFGLRLCGL